MRKTFVWALVAMMAVAGSAFAQTLPGGAPATLDNDSTCDISVAPAATLLLPYFEVDVEAGIGEGDTTLFTVTNVSPYPQIAHVTVWTDWSAPVLDFNIFLTGYDVQAINLYDIIVRGRIAEPGTTSDEDDNPPGERSADNDDNPNAAFDITNCDNLAVNVPLTLQNDIRSALTEGEYAGCENIGSVQPDGKARGYVTIDVAAACTTTLPTTSTYYTTELLYDNVLTGDYQQVDPANNFAQGGPLVHIRAIPEGGEPGAGVTNFERTFYSRYQAGGTADRRQPLPSTFAARWIEGGGSGFETSLKIWREGTTGSVAATAAVCDLEDNAALGIVEFVRFDEAENPVTLEEGEIISPAPEANVLLPETSRTSISNDDFFPGTEEGAVGGWIYLNLDSQAVETGSPADTASQNWVIVSMEAENRYSVDFDATWLGNGCSAAIGSTTTAVGAGSIQPADNENDPAV